MVLFDKSERALTGAYIIAGGQSSRMAMDKRLLELNGTPMLKIMVDLVRETFNFEPVLVGNNPVTVGKSEWIPDAYSSNGPIYGVVAALQHGLHGWVLIVAGDMPLLTQRDLKTLVDQRDDEHDVFTLGVNGVPEPLCGVYHSSTTNYWDAQIRHGNRSLLDGLQGLNVKTLPPPSGSEALFNVNDSNDLERAGKLLGQKAG